MPSRRASGTSAYSGKAPSSRPAGEEDAPSRGQPRGQEGALLRDRLAERTPGRSSPRRLGYPGPGPILARAGPGWGSPLAVGLVLAVAEPLEAVPELALGLAERA